MNLVYAIFTVYLSALIDKEHLVDGDYIESHKSRFLFRLLIITGFSGSLIEMLGYTFFVMAIFDQTLNTIMGSSLWYLGTEAEWDKYFSKHRTQYIIVKVVGLVIGIFCLYLTMDIPDLYLDIYNKIINLL